MSKALYRVYLLKLIGNKIVSKIGYAREDVMNRVNRTYLEPLGISNQTGKRIISMPDMFETILPKACTFCEGRLEAQILENSIKVYFKEKSGKPWYKNIWFDDHFDGITEVREWNEDEVKRILDIFSDHALYKFSGKYEQLHLKSMKENNGDIS